MAWLVIGSVAEPIAVSREVVEDRSGAWYIMGQNPSHAARYRVGDGMLYFNRVAAMSALRTKLETVVQRAQSRLDKVNKWIEENS